MQNKYNSINSEEYHVIKKLLNEIIDGDFSLNENLKKLNDISLTICALFVAIKEKKYRESSLGLLNQLIDMHTFEYMYNILQNTKTKAYKITSLDISLTTRRDIIKHMFSELQNSDFHYAIIFSLGFYLTPEIMDLLEEYKKSNNKTIQQEATYAIEFIERKIEKLK